MSQQRTTRRLAAILAADMVGFSRLIERDEEGTLTRQRTLMSDIISPEIEAHGGRLFKTMGDGFLAEYASAVDAVSCAGRLQSLVTESQAEIAEDRKIAYRIGINLGDVVIDGDDIFGNGVNVAARLEPLAEPGGICVSAKVFDEVRNQMALSFQDIGQQRVKNISQPIRAYRLMASGGESPNLQNADFSVEKPAIAVMPFENRSGDPEQDYFSDGLSEDIITLLSAWRSFPVVARQSSFAYRGQTLDIRQIARDLGARYVIEGSVRKGGNRVRVTAQLIDADSGHHIWADKYDGSLDDVFEIQDEITRRIVAVVEPEMEKAELARAQTERASNLNAWDCYLQGRERLHMLTADDTRIAHDLFEQSIALDPDYSDAWAGLSQSLQRYILLEIAENRQDFTDRAIEAAHKAVSLDPSSAVAHYALASAYIWNNQHQLSIAETRLAVELNPSYSHATLALGNRLDIVGQSAEGIPLLQKSLELHPKDPHGHIYFGQLARAYIVAERYEEALDCLNRSISRRPDYPHTYHLLAICYGHMNRPDDARSAADTCEALHPGFMQKRAGWNIYVDPASNRHLADGLAKAGLPA